MNKILGALIVSAGLVFAGQVNAATYEIDTVHSSIGFSVKHMMVSTVTGDFGDYKGTISYDETKPEATTADVTIQAKSINTRNEKRDDHMRASDFFDTEKYPTITFKGKSMSGNNLVGDLTIKDVTKEVSVPLTIEGPVKGMQGNIIGLSGEFTINRQDYGVNFNKTLDNGGLAVGNDVKVIINLEAIEKK